MYTFGIGRDCDRDLVIGAAEAGNGEYSFVDQENMNSLKAKVIDSLAKASDPALIDCQLQFLNKSSMKTYFNKIVSYVK